MSETSMLRVTTVEEVGFEPLRELLARYELELVLVPDEGPIPGSYFGEPEAGLIQRRVFVHRVTPVQSALHETCHNICMTVERRAALHTDAGGGYDEEDGVCYLQSLLADQLPGMGRERMWADMDSWGYTFRLGSAQEWFEKDADDARSWLLREGLIDEDEIPLFRLRGEAIGEYSERDR